MVDDWRREARLGQLHKLLASHAFSHTLISICMASSSLPYASNHSASSRVFKFVCQPPENGPYASRAPDATHVARGQQLLVGTSMMRSLSSPSR